MIPVAVLLALLGCRCREAPPPERAVLPHYGEWERLVDVAAQGDLETARVMARDLTEGDVVDPTDDGAAAVGAALGFLQVGEAEDLGAGIGRAAAACGECHEAREVEPMQQTRPPFTHQDAARWATFGLVWNESDAPPPATDAITTRLVESWKRPISAPDTGPPRSTTDVDRTEQLLDTCRACHLDDGG